MVFYKVRDVASIQNICWGFHWGKLFKPGFKNDGSLLFEDAFYDGDIGLSQYGGACAAYFGMGVSMGNDYALGVGLDQGLGAGWGATLKAAGFKGDKDFRLAMGLGWYLSEGMDFCMAAIGLGVSFSDNFTMKGNHTAYGGVVAAVSHSQPCLVEGGLHQLLVVMGGGMVVHAFWAVFCRKAWMMGESLCWIISGSRKKSCP